MSLLDLKAWAAAWHLHSLASFAVANPLLSHPPSEDGNGSPAEALSVAPEGDVARVELELL